MLGANDGIVSVAGLVMGVAGATTDRHTILVAGLAGLVAGALSMAAGEYVSVSTQRDTERALIAKETRELSDEPEDELAELAELYRQKGLSEDLARQVAARADRAGRAPGAPRHRARHRPGRADQPVAGRVGLDDLLHRSAHCCRCSRSCCSPPDLRVVVTLVAVGVALAGTGFAQRADRGRTRAPRRACAS